MYSVVCSLIKFVEFDKVCRARAGHGSVVSGVLSSTIKDDVDRSLVQAEPPPHRTV